MKAYVVLAALVGLLAAPAHLDAKTITDSAGRKVEVPDNVRRVLTAGPPASVAVYTLAPDKLVGWVRPPSPAEKMFLAPQYRDLPVHGQLTSGGGGINTEAVLNMKPDVIIDMGTVDPTYASLADRVQQQTGIPYVLIDGKFDRTAQTYRELGAIIGAEQQAAVLAAYAEKAVADLQKQMAAVPLDKRPRVYYGRGPRALETGLAGSINMEVLESVGAANVAAAAGRGGLTNVSMEQVIGWNPDVVLVADQGFYNGVMKDPLWQGVKAVRDGRVYRSPAVPWGWMDSPPGANRLIGVRWLMGVLYNAETPAQLRTTARDFYKLFYHVDVTDAQLDDLMKEAVSSPPK